MNVMTEKNWPPKKQGTRICQEHEMKTAVQEKCLTESVCHSKIDGKAEQRIMYNTLQDNMNLIRKHNLSVYYVAMCI